MKEREVIKAVQEHLNNADIGLDGSSHELYAVHMAASLNLLLDELISCTPNSTLDKLLNKSQLLLDLTQQKINDVQAKIKTARTQNSTFNPKWSQ